MQNKFNDFFREFTNSKCKLATSYCYINNKYDSSLPENLYNQFTKTKSTNFDLSTMANLDLSNASNVSKKSLELVMNEIFNKLNFYKQILNFKEEINLEFQINSQIFFNQFEKILLEIFQFSNTSLIKESIVRIENLINNNQTKFQYLNQNLDSSFDKSEESPVNLNEYMIFIKTLSSLFIFLEENFVFDIEGEKNNLFNLNNYLQSISDLSNTIYDKSKENNNFRIKLSKNNINSFFAYETPKKGVTSNFQTSKKDDEFIFLSLKKSRDEEKNTKIINQSLRKKVLNKTKNVFDNNFFHVYLIKEDDIFSESYFSKCEKSKANYFKRFPFFKATFSFHHQEESENINDYIRQILSQFKKYFITFQDKETDKGVGFIKVIIAGSARNKKVFENRMKSLIRNQVKNDCLLKIEIFPSFNNCMLSVYKKFHKKSEIYKFFTNIKSCYFEEMEKNFQEILTE